MTIRVVCDECQGRPALDCAHNLIEHVGHRVVVIRREPDTSVVQIEVTTRVLQEEGK